MNLKSFAKITVISKTGIVKIWQNCFHSFDGSIELLKGSKSLWESEEAEKIRQMAKDYDEETTMLEETLIEPYTYNTYV